MISITFLSFFLLGILLLLPFAIAYFVGSEWLSKPLKATAFHILSIVLMVFLVHYVIFYHNIFINILFVVAVSLFTTFVTLLRIRVPKSSYAVPLLLSTLGIIVLLLLCTLLAFNPLLPWQNGPWMVTTTLVVCSSIFMIVPKGIRTFHNGLTHDAQLYHFLIANGAPHTQAVNYLMRRSIEKTWFLALKNMALVFVGVCPWVFATMIFSGLSAVVAGFTQLFFASLVVLAPMVVVFFTLFFSRKYTLDPYHQLKK